MSGEISHPSEHSPILLKYKDYPRLGIFHAAVSSGQDETETIGENKIYYCNIKFILFI